MATKASWRRNCHRMYLSAITVTNISQQFLPTRLRQKSTGIDMERLLCHCYPVHTTSEGT